MSRSTNDQPRFHSTMKTKRLSPEIIEQALRESEGAGMQPPVRLLPEADPRRSSLAHSAVLN
jgi:hypothetical protein